MWSKDGSLEELWEGRAGVNLVGKGAMGGGNQVLLLYQLWVLVPSRSAGFGVGVDTESSSTSIPAGAPGAVSLPLDQIISDLTDHQTEGKLSSQSFTSLTMPVVAPLGLKGSSLGVLNM